MFCIKKPLGRVLIFIFINLSFFKLNDNNNNTRTKLPEFKWTLHKIFHGDF